MKKLLSDNKKFIFAIVALCVAICILISEVYAWFFVAQKTATNYFSVGVINLEQQSSSVNVTVVGGSGGNYEKIIPGSSLTAMFTVNNEDAQTENYEIYLNSFSQSYPQNNLAIPLLDNDVYKVEDSIETKIDLDKEEQNNSGFKNSFYSEFRSRISNALSYRIYSSSVPTGDYAFLSSKINGNTIVDDMLAEISVAGNTSVVFYFEVWFNPNYYPTCTINDVDYIIKNSNPFIGQTFGISLGVRNI